MKYLISFILILTIVIIANAQQLNPNYNLRFTPKHYLLQTSTPNTNTPFCDKGCWASVLAFSIGSAVDVHSSMGHKELNPFVRNENDKRFNLTKGIMYRGLSLVTTFIGQKKWPDRMKWIRYGLGGLYLAVGIRNYIVTKPSGVFKF